MNKRKHNLTLVLRLFWFFSGESFNDHRQQDNFGHSEDHQASHRGHEEQTGYQQSEGADREMDMDQGGHDHDQQVQDDCLDDHQGQDGGHYDENQGQDNSGHHQHGQEDMNAPETNDNQVLRMFPFYKDKKILQVEMSIRFCSVQVRGSPK